MFDRIGGHRLTADAPFAARDFRNLDPSHAALILAFDRRYRVGQFLDHLFLLLGIELVLDEMNFYQWHCRPPKWQPRSSMPVAVGQGFEGTVIYRSDRLETPFRRPCFSAP
jgi:hypothetical protein